jgi:hypothetical protein
MQLQEKGECLESSEGRAGGRTEGGRREDLEACSFAVLGRERDQYQKRDED